MLHKTTTSVTGKKPMVGIINKHNDILLKKKYKENYITYQSSTEPLQGHFLMIIIKHPCFPLNYYLTSHKYHLFENKYYLYRFSKYSPINKN